MEQEIKALLLSECEEDFLLGVAIIKSGHVQFTRKDFDDMWMNYPSHGYGIEAHIKRTNYLYKLADALDWIPRNEQGDPLNGIKEINYYKEENNNNE